MSESGSDEGGGSKVMGWVGLILFVILLNVLSSVFDWGYTFW